MTEQGAESPEDGVMVRLVNGPVLWSGLRPFLAAHYTPLPAALGMGAVECNLDLIHAISQFLSQSQDNARLTANAQLLVRRGSSASRQIASENSALYPGKVWLVDDPDDIRPFPVINFPQQDVNQLINYLNALLERRTGVSDTTLGIAGSAKTATEAHILQEASLNPFSTRTDLFARSFLEPMGSMALSMLRQFIVEDQTIAVRDSTGNDAAVTITAREIHQGKFRVAATLTRQDSTRIAKAQSIERALPMLARFSPILAGEGMRISFTELVKRYMDLIGVDGSDRMFVRISPETSDRSGSTGNTIAAGSHEDGTSRNPTGNGPMGDDLSDANALAAVLQRQAQI